MSPDNLSDTARPLRADAQRNRATLIQAAREAFAAAGDAGQGVPLENIARDAGVGIGTLYRHFPTREALVEAVYATELDRATSNIGELLAHHRADIAMRMWMDRYAEFVQAKQGLMQTLRAGWATGSIATPTTREKVTAAIQTIIEAGQAQGVFRADAIADDVTSLLLGIFLSTSSGDAPGQTERLLDLVVDALRAPGSGRQDG